jgi:hypothetical protein
VAALSYALARNARFSGKPDEAMLAGLLHAVGKFYIYMRAADHPQLFADQEALRGLMSQWHTGVARAIVESWGFPDSIAHAVDEQELKERDRIASADASDVLFVANIIARTGRKAAAELGDLDALARPCPPRWPRSWAGSTAGSGATTRIGNSAPCETAPASGTTVGMKRIAILRAMPPRSQRLLNGLKVNTERRTERADTR